MAPIGIGILMFGSVGDVVQRRLGGPALVEEVHPSGWGFELIYPHPTSRSLSIL